MGFVEKRGALYKKLTELIAHLGWKLDLERKAATLSIAEQQLVELLRGLMREAKLLILDEPTSSLTFNEVESLFSIIRDLKAKNIGVIYITHRLSEVFEIADRVMIMRDGLITLNGPVKDFTRDMLVAGLLPPDSQVQTVKKEGRKEADYSAPPALVVERLSGYGFEDINLKVYPGEVLGLAGVVGAGRTELATTIFGRDVVKEGHVYINGKDVTGHSTSQMLDEGLNYVAEDRFLNGIFRISNVAANITAASLKHMSRFFVNFKEEKRVTQSFVDAFRIKITGQDQLIGSLSGGNQQKVVIAKGVLTNPKALLLDEPSRGIDVGAKQEVFDIIRRYADQGLAILMVSSELKEIMSVADRVVVLSNGKVTGRFDRGQMTEQRLVNASYLGHSIHTT